MRRCSSINSGIIDIRRWIWNLYDGETVELSTLFVVVQHLNDTLIYEDPGNSLRFSYGCLSVTI